MAKAVSNLMAKAPVMLKGVVESSKPRFAVFMKYARVELAPPSPTEIPQVIQGFNKLIGNVKSGVWKTATVKTAWLNTLVGMEITFWFFLGECIGKRKLIGYEV
ncbi:ATP synthase subunit g, mitochondrial [Centruroides vittatus]|uniref:ATP synthase subunit g, mitochondrial n=1 Tax=Centruroides vittatus TaxID=120091 RepID=UPI00350F197E